MHLRKSSTLDPLIGYFVKPSKSCVIVKKKNLENVKQIIEGTGVKVTEDGRRHLGFILGTNENRKIYIDGKIMKWCKEIEALSKIATSEPHGTYALPVWTEISLYIFYENNPKHLI